MIIFLAIVLAAFSWRDAWAQGRAQIFVYDPNPRAAATPTPRARPARRIPAWPVDELKDDESFKEFRADLRDAIQRRDSNAIRRVMSHDFVAEYCCEGAPRGQEAIVKWWKSVESPGPGTGNFWPILGDVLKFGVEKSSGPDATYCGPAFKLSGSPPEGAGEIMIVAAREVPLRKEPRAASPVVAHVSWEAVRMLPFGEAGAFWLVSTGDGRSGYVDKHALRDPDMDPQVCFAKEPNGGWAIRKYDDGGD